MTDFVENYFRCFETAAGGIDPSAIDGIVRGLRGIRDGNGRLFVLGVGGSAANASHSVNDFRKLCGIEAYAPTDNVAELTARTNDEGWETVFSSWLAVSQFNHRDGLLVFSVGGGDVERGLSVNLIRAVELAREVGAKVYGIVGRETGYTAKEADVAVIVPCPEPALLTPVTESFQAIIWHCLVSHPDLQIKPTMW